MPRYLDTRGRTRVAIAICARCSQKFPYDELLPDPNSPGLYVCKDDLDELDPYRLPARQSENITLEHPRPDVSLLDEGPTPLFGLSRISGIVDGALLATPISSLRPARPWQPNTFYNVGDTITPQDVDDQNVDLPQRWFVCLSAGLSGSAPPDWSTMTGTEVTETP